MRKFELSEGIAYGLVGLLSVSAAFLISFRFLTRSHGQDTGVPPAPATEAPAANTPPPSPSTAQTAPPTNAQTPAATASAPAPSDTRSTDTKATAAKPADTAAAPAPPTANAAEGEDETKAAPSPNATKAVTPEQGREASELEGFLEPFIYDSVNRRDPFLPFSDYQPSEGGSGSSRPLTPAQRFDLDQLKLIGIMWDVKDPKAMFLDPEQEVMVLGRDEGIGNRNGYIAAIREGEVVVVEAMRRRGDIIYKTRVLRIER